AGIEAELHEARLLIGGLDREDLILALDETQDLLRREGAHLSIGAVVEGIGFDVAVAVEERSPRRRIESGISRLHSRRRVEGRSALDLHPEFKTADSFGPIDEVAELRESAVDTIVSHQARRDQDR